MTTAHSPTQVSQVSHVSRWQPLRTAALTFTVVAAAALAVGHAEAMPHGGPGGPMMMGEHMLDSVNASAEQRTQIKSIMSAAHADMRAQHQAGRSLREQMVTLFTQPTVDARAAETLRQQMQAQHEASSKRMLQAMLDASRVLTAEQRQQLGRQMAQRQSMMERHRAERDALDGGKAAR